MSVYIKATNTGEGFITHEDKETFEITNLTGDIWEVSGNYQAWVARVGGVEQDAAPWDKFKTNQPILAQIASLENAQLLPRVSREFMRAAYLQAAVSQGITEAELRDKQGAKYSPAYDKLATFNDQIAMLRSALV